LVTHALSSSEAANGAFVEFGAGEHVVGACAGSEAGVEVDERR
jgi:hypothetical protein